MHTSTQGRSWGRHAALLTLLCVSVASSACGHRGSAAPSGGSDVRPSQVRLQKNVDVTQVQQRAIVYHVETVGVLEAEGQTDVAAGVSGVIDEILFREGDEVLPGTVLAKIDQDRYKAEVEAAEATVERAKVSAALAADLADRASRAGKGASEEDRVKTRGLFNVAEAELRVARANLVRAQHNLNRSRVCAPYAGRINKRMVTKGSYVEEKTPIATIADLSRIRLVGYVPETAAAQVHRLFNSQDDRLIAARLGLTFAGLGPAGSRLGEALGTYLVGRDHVVAGFDPEFELLALPGKKFHARLFYMSTVGAPDTHMFEAKAEILGYTPEIVASTEKAALDKSLAGPSALSNSAKSANGAAPRRATRSNGGGRDFELRPGFTVRIRFPMRSNSDALVIPEEAGKWEAVRPSEHGYIVFVPALDVDEQGKVVRDGDGKPQWVARRRVLELGYRAPGWVEVRSGLSAGEWVVRRGADTLEDGTPLSIPEKQVRQMLQGQ